jgi:hypothetical protein
MYHGCGGVGHGLRCCRLGAANAVGRSRFLRAWVLEIWRSTVGVEPASGRLGSIALVRPHGIDVSRCVGVGGEAVWKM